MRIMVMDGQGGGVGRSLLEALKEKRRDKRSHRRERCGI